MNSRAQSQVSNPVAHGALNRVADMAGRKAADFAIQKALPYLRNMDRKKIITLVALAGVGAVIYQALNRYSPSAMD